MLPSLLCSCSVAERVSELSFASAQASDSNKQFPPRRSASNEASCEFPWETCTLVECGLQRLSMQDTREYKERFLLEPSRRMSCSRGIASLCVDGTSMIEIVDSAMHFQPCASSSLATLYYVRSWVRACIRCDPQGGGAALIQNNKLHNPWMPARLHTDHDANVPPGLTAPRPLLNILAVT